jgi:DNA-binding SARP family transcriptional activator
VLLDRRNQLRLMATRLEAAVAPDDQLDVLAEIHAENREPALALRAAEQAVALEPFRESGYRRLMRLHLRGGDRGEALRVYERCRRLLAEELGTKPSEETETLRADVAAS